MSADAALAPKDFDKTSPLSRHGQAGPFAAAQAGVSQTGAAQLPGGPSAPRTVNAPPENPEAEEPQDGSLDAYQDRGCIASRGPGRQIRLLVRLPSQHADGSPALEGAGKPGLAEEPPTAASSWGLGGVAFELDEADRAFSIGAGLLLAALVLAAAIV